MDKNRIALENIHKAGDMVRVLNNPPWVGRVLGADGPLYLIEDECGNRFWRNVSCLRPVDDDA